jgi:integrase
MMLHPPPAATLPAGTQVAMITVALRTGLRLGELLALRWSDVDLDARRIIVRPAVARGVVGTPKNGRTREVGLSKQAASALRDHLRRGSLVFAAADGSMLTKGLPSGCTLTPKSITPRVFGSPIGSIGQSLLDDITGRSKL